MKTTSTCHAPVAPRSHAGETRNTHHAPRTTLSAFGLRPSDFLRTSDFGLRTSRERAIALIIVMISVFVLTMLAIGFAYSMKVEAKLASNADNETEIEWLGRSGVQYACQILSAQLMVPQEPYDALNQIWAGGSGGIGTSNSVLANVQHEVHLGHGSYTWKITDLERKFNINIANEVLLEQAFTHMGMDAGEMTPVIGSILNWTAAGNNTHHPQGANTEYYQSLDPPYEAKNGPIDDISELLLIKGVTLPMYAGGEYTNHPQASFQRRANSHFGSAPDAPIFTAGLIDLFTPVSSGRINLNTCSAEVLEVLPPTGIDPLVAEAIVGARGGEDDGTGLTGPYRSVDQVRRVPEVTPIIARQIQQFCDTRSRTFQVEVEAQVGGYKRQFIAIVGRNNPRDVQVLSFYWK